MSSADIQIVSEPNLAKIESFFKDSSYRETIEFSANFNTRLCVERRLRLPFLDPQTGVAQNHSHLFMDPRQRMPGFREGQIYTYPAARWRKSRRQYLTKMYRFPDRPFQSVRKDNEPIAVNNSHPILAHSTAGTASPSLGSAHHENDLLNGSFLEESSSLGAAGGDTSDSKDSQQQVTHTQQQQQHMKEDLSKEWFYDDMDMNDVDSLEEPKSPADDEYDYDPRYGTKKRRKRRPGKRATITPGEGNVRRRSGAGRGRSHPTAANSDTSYVGLDAIDGVIADGSLTPTTSSGRRSRGTRGRRRAKATNLNSCNQPPSPGLNSEPPSFETAAAAVGVPNDSAGVEEHGDLRNYRKYI